MAYVTVYLVLVFVGSYCFYIFIACLLISCFVRSEVSKYEDSKNKLNAAYSKTIQKCQRLILTVRSFSFKTIKRYCPSHSRLRRISQTFGLFWPLFFFSKCLLIHEVVRFFWNQQIIENTKGLIRANVWESWWGYKYHQHPRVLRETKSCESTKKY